MFSFRAVRLFGIPGGRQELPAGIKTRNSAEPEPVHEVKIRAKGRKKMGFATNKCSKDAVLLKPFYPEGKGRRSESHRDHKEEKDKRAQDLWLVFGRPAGMGIKRQEKLQCYIGIEEEQLLPGAPKFGVEP